MHFLIDLLSDQMYTSMFTIHIARKKLVPLKFSILNRQKIAFTVASLSHAMHSSRFHTQHLAGKILGACKQARNFSFLSGSAALLQKHKRIGGSAK